jgi:hypothetical protein
MIDVNLVDAQGVFLHATVLPEAPRAGQCAKIHNRLYIVGQVTWNLTRLTRQFSYQQPGLEVTVEPLEEE